VNARNQPYRDAFFKGKIHMLYCTVYTVRKFMKLAKFAKVTSHEKLLYLVHTVYDNFKRRNIFNIINHNYFDV
jgi:hypothetical protein